MTENKTNNYNSRGNPTPSLGPKLPPSSSALAPDIVQWRMPATFTAFHSAAGRPKKALLNSNQTDT